MKPVKLDDKKTEALLGELLPGENPTPPRVRQLLQELSERRKAPAMPTLEEQEADAARAAGIHLPDAPQIPQTVGEPFAEPGTGPAPAAEVPDEDQAELIRAGIESFRAFDERRRQEIQRLPVSRLHRASRIETLTEAAHALLGELDPQQRDRVLEISQENNWPPWVVVLGAVARAADLQELLSGDMKPEWLSQSERSEKAAPSATKCEMCGGSIPGARRGQRFCCSAHGSEKDFHSEGCPLHYLVLLNGSWVDSRR